MILALATASGCVGQIGGDETASAYSGETGCTPPPPVERTVAAGKVLFVVGDTNLGQGDQAALDRLAELGFTVTTRRAAATQAADTNGMDLVVVSSTSLSTDVGSRLRDIAVPVVTWESSLFDDFRMTGSTDGADYGTVDHEDQVDIVGASHPIAQAAHLGAGAVDVLNGSGELRFGKPGSAAQVIARLHGSSSRAAVFAYEAGAALVGGGHAAKRRVGLYYSDDSAYRFNDAAWQLFDASMLWACGLPTQGAPAGDVLFVVGNTNLDAADAALRSRLQGLGLTVALRADHLVSTADAADRKLVLISETVDSAQVGTKLRDVTVPVIDFEESLFDDLRLTGSADGNDFGNVNGQTKIDVIAPSHPIAVDAGLGAGLVTVVGQDDTFHFGKPAAGAQVVATLAGQAGRATVWTYSQGAQMVGGQAAPARRVGAFFGDRTARRLNATGFRLFDAMVRWAIGVAPPASIGPALLVVGDDCLSASDAALRDRLAALGLQVTVKKGTEAKTVDATGKRLVVISSTTLSTDVGTKFRDVTVPVFTWEPALFDDLRFAGPTENQNWGSVDGQTKINVVSASHPIATDAGLGAGVATVVTTADTFRWAKVGNGAQIVATLDGQASRAALFTYDVGAAMVGGNAPARRVGAFFSDDFGTRLSGNGAKIFDACVRWAIATPGPTCVPHTEVCNGQDDDCDGQVDEGVTTTFYRDQDGDGFGRASTTQVACSAPAGFVAQQGDCDDGNATRYPGAPELCNQVDDNCSGTVDEGLATQTYFRDADGDSFGDAMVKQVSCAQPAGYVPVAGDCNDAVAATHPGAAEVCNMIDDDCDGTADDGATTTFYRDLDGDGFGNASSPQQACAKPAGYASNNTDCNDTAATVHPGAPEQCNQVDDNCNGATDEGLATQTYIVDADHDGYGALGGATQVSCSQPAGYASVGGDCNDGSAAVHPGAAEVCNGVDDNCAGGVDENPTNGTAFYRDADTDGYGLTSSRVVACQKPTTGGVEWVTTSGDCNDALDSVHPGADEMCNGIDDNCNGQIDSDTVWYADADADSFGDMSTVKAHGCPMPDETVVGKVVTNHLDCDDHDDLKHPGADEICNGQDDDCDGVVDNDAVDEQEYYNDADGDGYGDHSMPVQSCEQPPHSSLNENDCDDTNASVNPGATEIVGNHRDDNCDGVSP